MIDLQNSYFVILLGGVAFFMYGMTMASQALEKLMASRISLLLNKVSSSNVLAIVVGISLTTVLQSSGAVTSMLVGLGSAKVISLSQVMGVIIGTAIGSTLTVQLISFNLSQYALPTLIVFFTVYFLAKKSGIKNFALVFMGFSFLFLGLGLISAAAHHYAGVPSFQEFLITLKSNPHLSLLISMVFCAFVHSSAATIGVAMGLAQAGAISLNDAMFWVYGANIGTTSTALIAAVGSNHVGKQVAWAHFFYKTLSVAIFLIEPFHNFFVKFVGQFETTIYRSIANGHLIFNIASAAIFFPFIRPASQLIEKMFPKDPKDDFTAEYLSMNNYQSTALAISYAQREILRTADIVLSMIRDSVKLFETADPSLIESIKDRDNKVDYLYRETKMFLLDHANKSQSVVHQNVMSMIMFLSDLERAADSIDINITTLAIKKNALKLEFSEEGWKEILEMHAQVIKVAQMAISAYTQREMCEETIQLKRELAKMEINLRENHIGRLNKGMRESINTSSIHLDLLSEYKRIAGLLCSHAYSRL
ncbi:MAG: Na/Pi cotransporter family protein [Proteobacteria bacterium]|jgi:phosphate:Na+ symporter|nr:Na/Pi cotransporter family protein [Pseudomonadota bacterium]